MTAKKTTVPLDPPVHLTDAAREVWRVTVRAMADARTLAPENLPQIERYAAATARWREAQAKIATEGSVITARRSGVEMLSPWLSVARAAAAEAAKAEIELGLSPARRGRAHEASRPLRANGTRGPRSDWERLADQAGSDPNED
jgi:P27 family predicted phage terminase small subunit